MNKLLILIILILLSSCISIPHTLDLERGACVVAFPDREDICLEITSEECILSQGEYNGDGSTCDGINSNNSIATTEPSPVDLNRAVIYSVGGAITAIVAAWAGNKAIRRRKRGTK